MRVLIVDDNPQFRESLEIYVTMRLGYEIIGSFKNAFEFLESKELHSANIILMDIELPEMDGIEATKKALWKRHDLNVIAVTNYQDKAYLDALINAGFKACVFKNNVFDELDIAIKKVLKKRLYFPSNKLP